MDFNFALTSLMLLMNIEDIRTFERLHVTCEHKNICAVRETDVTLRCSFANRDIKTVFWFNKKQSKHWREKDEPEDLTLDSDYSGRVKQRSTYYPSELTITDVRERDSGEYQLMFIMKDGVKRISSVTVNLTVTGESKVSLMINGLSIFIRQVNVLNVLFSSVLQVKLHRTGMIYQREHLTCETSCPLTSGRQHFYWKKDGRYITFGSVEPAAYSCYYTQDFKISSAPLCLSTSSCWDVTYTSRRVCALVGSTVNIHSSYSHPTGYTVENTFWHLPNFNSLDLREKHQFVGRVEYVGNTLRIKDVNMSDSGEYQFRFITDRLNCIFSGSPGVILTVTDTKVTSSLDPVIEGEKVILSCSTKCTLDNNMSFSWFKNGKSVTDGFKLFNKLYLNSVNNQELKEYSCSVTDIRTFERLHVTCEHKNICAVRETDVTLRCSFANRDIKTVFWFNKKQSKHWREKDEPEDLTLDSDYSGRVKQRSTYYPSELTITDVRERDSGEYQLMFIMKDGVKRISSVTVNLTVTGESKVSLMINGLSIFIRQVNVLNVLFSSVLQVKLHRTGMIYQREHLTCETSCPLTSGRQHFYWKKDGRYITFGSVEPAAYSCYYTQDFKISSAPLCLSTSGCWDVTYTSRRVCALVGSTVNIHSSYSHPTGYTVVNTFWHLSNFNSLDLREKHRFVGRVEYVGNTLRIKDVNMSDSGEYRFRFITDRLNGTFSGSPGVILTVTDTKVTSSPDPVIEGEKVILSCSTKCTLDNNMTFLWFKNRKPVTDGFKLFNKLYLNSVNNDELKKYSCTVTDLLTSEPIRVICKDKNICAVSETDVKLMCSYSNISIKTGFWFSQKQSKKWREKNEPEDLTLDSDYSGRVKQQITVRQSDLSITAVKVRDSGEYQLMFIMNDGTKYISSVTVNLTVTVLQVKVIHQSTEQQVQLICDSSCELTPGYYYDWYKNGQILNAYSKNILMSSSGNADSYSCSESGKQSQSTSVCASNSGCWYVTYTSRRVCALVGSTVEIHSSYSLPTGYTVVNTYWHLSNFHLDLREEHQFVGRVEYEENTLRIKDVKTNDSGEYQFRIITNTSEGKLSGSPGVILTVTDTQVASSPDPVVDGENVILHCSTKCTLDNKHTYIWYKNGAQVTDGFTLLNKVYLNSASREEIKQYSCAATGSQTLDSFSVTYTKKNICAVRGAEVTLRCSYTNTNFNIKTVFWFNEKQSKNWREKDEPEDLTLDSDYSGRVKQWSTYYPSELTITDVRERDSGEYQLMFIMKDGVKHISSDTLNLTVTVLQVKVIHQSTEQQVKLICDSSCELTPGYYYDWYKNGQILNAYSKNILVSSRGNTDSYSCSKSGKQSQSTSVCASNSSCWDVTYTSRRVCALVGSTVEIHSSYSHPTGYTVVNTSWHLSNLHLDLREEHQFVGRVEYEENTLRIKDVKTSDSGEYRFRIITNTSEGKLSGSPGVILTVTDTQVTSSPDPVVDGENVILHCSTKCTLDNKHTYIWYKNGTQVTDGFTLLNKLYLNSASREEIQRYSCAATGSVTLDSFSVTYTKKYICAVRGAEVTLRCSYTNTNFNIKTVFWFNKKQSKNWREKKEPEDLTLDSDYSGRVRELTITDVRERDSGEYQLMFIMKDGVKHISSVTVNLTVTVLQVKVIHQSTEQQVQLICDSSCELTPGYYYDWYKNGQILNAYSKNILMSSSGNADSYSCSKSGKQSQSTSVCASNSGCWYVTYTSRRVCALVGSTVEIHSSYSHPTGYTVVNTYWHLSNFHLDLREEHQFVGRVEYEENTLRIKDVKTNDSGEYQFRIITNTSEGKLSGSPGVILTVTDTQVASSPDPVVDGENVILHCSTKCTLDNKHTYIWYKNGAQVTDGFTLLNKVYLNSASREEIKQYSCAATGSQTLDSFSVTYTKKNICAVRGAEVTLRYSYTNTNFNIKTVFWFNEKQSKNWREKDEPEDLTLDSDYSGRVKQWSTYYPSELTITDVRERDSGEYQLMFIMKDGVKHISSVTVNLTVTVLQVKVIHQSTEQQVKLICDSSCELTPGYYYDWYKNGQILNAYSKNILVSSRGNTDSYSCSKSGKQSQSTSVCASNSSCWDVTYTSRRVCALVGSTVEIHSSYSHPTGYTVVNTYWHLSNFHLDLREEHQFVGRVEYEENTLRIKDVKTSDSGEYRFRIITNTSEGKYSGSPGVILTVTGTQVTSSPDPVVDGENVILHCSTKCTLDNKHTYIWYKNGTQYEPVYSNAAPSKPAHKEENNENQDLHYSSINFGDFKTKHASAEFSDTTEKEDVQYASVIFSKHTVAIVS
ncbi:hypothetical protein E1301_Tti018678 [Triplophysa tibetana]|uniref:Ig-like domain-containing protein n=1 Tax=Triplophysa tibetana TaxID=1572043 RepID=A0A5A9NS59_9TELE|nr:hypothetical protein E1301_Tti018678 [Triplophysa tibetana]